MTDERPTRPGEAPYFILRQSGKDDAYDHAARVALLAYAQAIASTDAELAGQLRKWAAPNASKAKTPTPH